MTTPPNKDRLKNRFQNIEIKLDDSRLAFEIPAENIRQINPVNGKKKDIPVIYYYSSLTARVLKIMGKLTARGLEIIFSKVVLPMAKETQKTVVYTGIKLNKARMESEIKLTDYLSKVELEIEDKKEEKSKIIEQLNSEIENYKNELSTVFASVESEVSVSCEKNEFLKVKESLEYDISLYEMMVRKLTESKMITNVTKVVMKVQINEKNVINTIELDLKISGEKWAKLFSKHVSSEVMKKIENYSGSVKNIHVQTLIPVQDKFLFQFAHQRLDLFIDQTKSDNGPVKIKHPQISSLLDV